MSDQLGLFPLEKKNRKRKAKSVKNGESLTYADGTVSTQESLDADTFLTPIEVVKACIDRVVSDLSLYNLGRVSDVGANTGVWGDYYKRTYAPNCQLFGYEVRYSDPLTSFNYWIRGDYLQWEEREKFDLTWSNPPFSLSEEMIIKMVDELAPNGVCVVLQGSIFLGSDDRHHNFWSTESSRLSRRNRVPLAYVYLISNRIAFFSDADGKLKQPNANHCLYVFRKGWTAEPTLRWLAWK